MWKHDALIAEVRKNGGNTDWNATRRSLKCPHRCPRRGSTCSRCPMGSGAGDALTVTRSST
ncbi:hypothetical protein AB5I41_28900 [Sphingomonas sp. MMS24-JH45]